MTTVAIKTQLIRWTDTLENFLSFLTRETTVCFPIHQSSSQKESTLKGKNLSPFGQIAFPNRPLFRREKKQLTELSPFKVYPFPLNRFLNRCTRVKFYFCRHTLHWNICASSEIWDATVTYMVTLNFAAS